MKVQGSGGEGNVIVYDSKLLLQQLSTLKDQHWPEPARQLLERSTNQSSKDVSNSETCKFFAEVRYSF